MKCSRAIAVLLLLLPALGHAQKKPKPDTLAILGQARYVYVEAVDGDEFKPGLDPADRQAIQDVNDALRKWGRYTLTLKREEAELVFVVRKGRVAEGDVGFGSGPGPSPSSNPMGGGAGSQAPGHGPRVGAQVGAGVEVGPADDLLQICAVNPGGRLSGPLWNRSAKNGLDRPEVALIQQFKTAVDRAYPPTPASKP